MAKLQSELVLSLTDRVSGPVSRVDSAFRKLQDREAQMQRQFDRHRNMFAVTAGAAIAAGLAMREPIQQAMDFESKLEDINQKANLTKESLAALNEEIRRVGLETATGASATANAIDGLTAIGLDTDTAIATASPIGRVVTAYGADVNEMVALSGALLTNMDLTADDISRSFDIMATGGKLGQFELDDMAADFAEVTAAAQSLGISGQDGLADLVASLQVARLGAASGSAAVTNLSNYMTKLLAPDAIRKFGEAGVDIVAEVNAATASGVSPIERTIELLGTLTEGGKQDLLGKYFADQEVQKFIRPMIQNLDLYRQIREDALAADDVVERDFATRMETSGGVFARFEASVEELNITVGETLIPKLADFAASVTPMIDSVSEFIKANRELVTAVVEITAALVGLRLLASAGGMAMALLGMGKARNGMSLLGGSRGAGGKGAGGAPIGNPVRPGMNTAWAAPIVALQVGSDMAAHQSDVKANGIEPWLERRAANDAAIEAMLQDVDLWGFKPAAALKGAQDLIHNPEGGIGGGYTGATQGQIDDMKAEIAKLDAEILEWPEDGMEARRAGLAEKLAAMEAELAASGATLTTQFAATMTQLRLLAAAGVTIPMRTSGPALPAPPDRTLPGFSSGGYTGSGGIGDIAGLVHGREFVMNAAATRLHRPMLEALNAGLSMPTLSQVPAPRSGGTGGGPASITIDIGGIHLSNPTNADPNTIARAVGQIVMGQARGAFTNGAM